MQNTTKLLICAACNTELSGIDFALKKLNTFDTISYNPNIDITITGIGIFQTTYHLTQLLTINKYNRVLNVGIAGDYNANRELLNAFAVSKSRFIDIGFETEKQKFQPLVGSQFLAADTPPFSNGLINYNSVQKTTQILSIPTAIVNTVNKTNTDQNYVNKLLSQFPADLETMESAAIAYVCAQKGIELIEIRCTSNYILPKNIKKWQINEAVSKLGIYVNKLINDNRFFEN